MSDQNKSREAYWKKNRTLIAILLAIWATVSFGLAILFPMTFQIGQLPAGFWWAQQGSMFVFVILIFVYAWRMDKIDREFDVHEEE
jgi:putative solute:sodium symporter small subunit